VKKHEARPGSNLHGDKIATQNCFGNRSLFFLLGNVFYIFQTTQKVILVHGDSKQKHWRAFVNQCTNPKQYIRLQTEGKYGIADLKVLSNKKLTEVESGVN
jgi:hypothetical protein